LKCLNGYVAYFSMMYTWKIKKIVATPKNWPNISHCRNGQNLNAIKFSNSFDHFWAINIEHKNFPSFAGFAS